MPRERSCRHRCHHRHRRCHLPCRSSTTGWSFPPCRMESGRCVVARVAHRRRVAALTGPANRPDISSADLPMSYRTLPLGGTILSRVPHCLPVVRKVIEEDCIVVDGYRSSPPPTSGCCSTWRRMAVRSTKLSRSSGSSLSLTRTTDSDVRRGTEELYPGNR